MTGWPAWADPSAVRRLQDALQPASIGHAFLLSGPNGVGKAALAVGFAQALCCTSTTRTDPTRPCGVCRACINVERHVHPDVEWFDLHAQARVIDKPGKGSTLTIETIRRLRATADLFPLEANHRIVILDDAETLLEPAQQALLKTLEEPPSKMIILMLADEPEALLETVRSRCQHIVVHPVPENTIQASLQARGVSDERSREIATLSRGCPAWAIAAAGDPKMLQVRVTERQSALEWIASGAYERLVTAYQVGEQFGKKRAESLGVVQACALLLRDEMVESCVDPEIAGRGARHFAGASVPPLALSAAVGATLRCLADLDANVRPRLALEAMVLQWPILAPHSA